MDRELIGNLLEWKKSETRKPLILKGVRQCGKTYLLREFGSKYYEDTAYFNFEENEALLSVFEKDYDVNRIIFELELHHRRSIRPEQTLIIFDEAQECPRALTALKYFCENAPQYHIVCAGSLLGIALRRKLSFPVGKVDFMTLYPMSFTEYLRACEEEKLADFITNYRKNDALPEIAASRLESLLKEYYIVGGMPEAVQSWKTKRDIDALERIQQSIISSYELDFAKHAPANEFPKLQAIWRSIPQQLSRENTKFIFSHVKKGWRAKDLEDALEWLIGAGLVYKVCRVEKPFIPLSSYADDSAFKLYMADVGILRKLSKLPHNIILDSATGYKEFKGSLAENYVLGELVKNIDDTAYYWTSRNTAEVDFVVQCRDEIVPIEVKAQQHLKSHSLAEYRKKYAPKHAVKTSMLGVVSGEEIIKLPLYMICALKSCIL